MPSDLARYIDHTLLRPTGTDQDIRRLCLEAVAYGMAAVCIFPSFVHLAREMLRESRVHIATVVAFPFGVTYTASKTVEIEAAARQGADEVDIVLNIALLKSGQHDAVEDEMQTLTDRTRGLGLRSKFILETAYLTPEEKRSVYKMANRVRPDFLKTSTGYGPSGATVEDVRLLREWLIPEVQIKAAGGIRSQAQVLALLEAGATRIGTSAGVALVQESRRL